MQLNGVGGKPLEITLEPGNPTELTLLEPSLKSLVSLR